MKINFTRKDTRSTLTISDDLIDTWLASQPSGTSAINAIRDYAETLPYSFVSQYSTLTASVEAALLMDIRGEF